MSELALEKVGDNDRLHSVVGLLREFELADIVVVLTDSEDVLASAYNAGSVNHFVSHKLNETQAITSLFESDDVFVDEDDAVWVLRVGLEFDQTEAQAMRMAFDQGSPAGLVSIDLFR
jgi:hypothetical protein